MGSAKETLMVHTRFEITLQEPLLEIEAVGLMIASESKKWTIHVVNSGRIIVIGGPKTVKPIIKFLAIMGLGPDVALIKRICEYEPDEYEKDFVEIMEINDGRDDPSDI